jgi:ubiquitin-like protein ATG12
MSNDENMKKEDGEITSIVSHGNEPNDTDDDTSTDVLGNNPIEKIDTKQQDSDQMQSLPDISSEMSKVVDEKLNIVSESPIEHVTNILESESKSDIQEDEPLSSDKNPIIESQEYMTKKQKVHCIAVGNAPLMKKSKFLISSNESFGIFQKRLEKMLKLPTGSSLFMYIHQSFVPSPDDLVGDLGDLFGVNNELKIHYSLQEAWG